MSSSLIKNSLLMACFALGLSSQSSFAKQYYKWVDAKGSTHYTTTPPPKSAKKKGKVDTYGVTASSSSSQATPVNNAPQEESKPNTTVVTADQVIVLPKNEVAAPQAPDKPAEY